MKLKTFIVMGVFVCVQMGCTHRRAVPFNRKGWDGMDRPFSKIRESRVSIRAKNK